MAPIATFHAGHVGAAVLSTSGKNARAGDVEHVFDLASVTKPLVAYALLVAVEEGTVGLDDALGPVGATVAHLLAHASGLSPDRRDVALMPPGQARIYSNAGFELLGAHLENKSGMPCAAYLHQAVFEPLAMTSARLDGSPARDGKASVTDLERFVAELLAPTLISSVTLSRATNIAYPGLAGVVPGFGRFEHCDWGLGFELKDEKVPHWTAPSSSALTFGHFGQSGTFFWVDPVEQAGLVFLSDRSFGQWASESWPVLSEQVLRALRSP